MFANGAVALILCLAGMAAQAGVANWVRQLRTDTQSGGADCVLVSATQTVHDGYQDTPVHLELGEEALLVISDSNFDTTNTPLGLSVDAGDFITADELVSETRLAFTGNLDLIVDQFMKGNTAELRLRFWPTWPDTGDKTVSFSLLGFTRAYQSRQPCE